MMCVSISQVRKDEGEMGKFLGKHGKHEGKHGKHASNALPVQTGKHGKHGSIERASMLPLERRFRRFLPIHGSGGCFIVQRSMDGLWLRAAAIGVTDSEIRFGGVTI